MNYYILLLRKWYDQRILRERLLFIGLTIALIYAFFSLFFFTPVDKQINAINAAIKKSNEKIIHWQTQISALEQISQTPLYKEWVNQHLSLQSLQKKYNDMLQSNSVEQWQEVIKLILKPNSTITLAEVNTSPQSIYQAANLTSGTPPIYQQHITLTVYGNYFEILDYLSSLEKFLPNVRWNKLTYQVAQYPVGKVVMEFSLFYEKAN